MVNGHVSFWTSWSSNNSYHEVTRGFYLLLWLGNHPRMRTYIRTNGDNKGTESWTPLQSVIQFTIKEIEDNQSSSGKNHTLYQTLISVSQWPPLGKSITEPSPIMCLPFNKPTLILNPSTPPPGPPPPLTYCLPESLSH